MPRFAALLFVPVVAIALAGCGGGAAPAVTFTAAASTVTAPPVTVTPTTMPTPTEEEVEVADTSAETGPTETFTMPKLVAKNLQLAQDILQNEGSYLLDQTDALGLHRVQLVDSNWKVCAQSPRAGTTVPVDAMVTLAAVKLDEDCP